MILSSDFALRCKGAKDGFSVPEDKDAINDSIAETCLRIEGPLLSFLDVSRCRELSHSFIASKIPMICSNLTYLDISYTNCKDATSIYEQLLGLKALNMAGLNLINPTLNGIEYLDSLEILSIRASNIRDVRALAHLHCLRSLDLGETTLHSLHDILEGQRRLDELFLDECVIIGSLDKVETYISQLDSLKLLNIQDGSLSDWGPLFMEAIPRPLYFEASPRRTLFFETIVANNAAEMNYYLTAGQDINCRAKFNDSDFFHSIWMSRCTYSKAKLQTPFFVFEEGHEFEDFLPSALHLAIFFNSYECVQLLLALGADVNMKVFVSDIIPNDDGQLFDAGTSAATAAAVEGKSQVDCRVPIHARDLVQFCYDRTVHRFTSGMVAKKTTGWKSKTEKFRSQLDTVLRMGGNVYVKLLKQREEARRRVSQLAAQGIEVDEEQMMKELFGGDDKDMPKEDQAEENVAAVRRQMKAMAFGASTSLDELSQSDSIIKGPGLFADRHQGLAVGEGFPGLGNFTLRPDTAGSQTSQDSQIMEVGEEMSDKLPSGEHHNVKEGASIISVGEQQRRKVKRESRHNRNLLPKKATEMFTWRQHSMVQKLAGAPRIYKIEPLPASSWVTDSNGQNPQNQILQPKNRRKSNMSTSIGGGGAGVKNTIFTAQIAVLNRSNHNSRPSTAQERPSSPEQYNGTLGDSNAGGVNKPRPTLSAKSRTRKSVLQLSASASTPSVATGHSADVHSHQMVKMELPVMGKKSYLFAESKRLLVLSHIAETEASFAKEQAKQRAREEEERKRLHLRPKKPYMTPQERLEALIREIDERAVEKFAHR